jgi:putative lipoprotein
MKKISLYSLTALSFIVLAACSAKSTEETSSSSSSEVTSSVSTAKKSKSAGTSQEDVINELKSIFDPNGNSKDFDIKVEKDVKDEAFPNGHTVITASIKGDTAAGTKEMMAAFDNNTATEEDKQILQGFRQTIADIAQKLPDDTTTIAFQYETKQNEYRVIAHSGKTKDIIPTTVK